MGAREMAPVRLTTVVLLVTLGSALCGCSSGSYPPLPGLGGLGQKVLTPEEQQAKIKELANAQSAAGGTVQPAVLQQPAPAQ